MPAPDLRGRRVLVIGINYAPEHTGIARRTSTNACSYLAEQGAEVFVLTGHTNYPHWTVPPEYSGKCAAQRQHGPQAGAGGHRRGG